MEEWGLGWEILSDANPGLVFVRGSGYGQTGPCRKQSAFSSPMEQDMSLAAHLLAQLDAEHHSSRRVIERVTDDMLGWRPHEKSWTALELATHLANLVSWGAMILTTEELDFASDAMKDWKPPTAEDAAAAVALLDQNVAQVRGILEGMSDEDLEATWTMRSGDQVFSADPRIFAFTHWVLSHQSHHRGELVVYLRLNDEPVPGIFGPSADETEM